MFLNVCVRIYIRGWQDHSICLNFPTHVICSGQDINLMIWFLCIYLVWKDDEAGCGCHQFNVRGIITISVSSTSGPHPGIITGSLNWLKYFVLLVNNGNVLLKHQVLIAPPRSFVLMNKRQDRKVLKSYIKEEEVFWNLLLKTFDTLHSSVGGLGWGAIYFCLFLWTLS